MEVKLKKRAVVSTVLCAILATIFAVSCQSADQAFAIQPQQTASPAEAKTNQAATRVPDSFKVKSYDLKLEEREGKCSLRYGRDGKQEELMLDVEAPCRFVRKSSGTYDGACGLRSHEYKDIGATVLMVVGGLQMSNSLEPCTGEPCGTKHQAVIVRSENVTSSKVIDWERAVCPSNGPDEKVFWVYSHP